MAALTVVGVDDSVPLSISGRINLDLYYVGPAYTTGNSLGDCGGCLALSLSTYNQIIQ